MLRRRWRRRSRRGKPGSNSAGCWAPSTPDGIQELRTLVDLARTHRRDVVEMENRIAAIQTDIDEFIAMARPLADAHGLAAEWTDYPKVAGIADDIIELHRNVTEAARVLANAEKELEEAEQDLTG